MAGEDFLQHGSEASNKYDPILTWYFVLRYLGPQNCPCLSFWTLEPSQQRTAFGREGRGTQPAAGLRP